MDFRWNDWNVQHIAAHGVDPEEAEDVVEGARKPFPFRREDDKWLVWGPSGRGQLLQVVFVLDDEGSVFVIHARPLSEREKRRYRRRRR